MIDRITINSYHHKLTTSINCQIVYNGFHFYDNSNDMKLLLKSDEKINIGINTIYKRKGGEIRFSVYRDMNSSLHKSKSIFFKLENFGINRYIDLSYGYNKGFYWDQDSLSSLLNNMPDIKSMQISGKFIRWSNRSKYSYNAFLTFNEWQRYSAGSLITGFHFFVSHLFAQTSFFPEQVNGFFNRIYNAKGMVFFDLSAQLGYSYIFVYNTHFFFGIIISISLDIQFLEAWSGSESLIDGSTDFYMPLNMKFNCGYNGKQDSFGLMYSDDNYALRILRNTPVLYSVREISAFYAHRFTFSFPERIRISRKAFFSGKRKKDKPDEGNK